MVTRCNLINQNNQFIFNSRLILFYNIPKVYFIYIYLLNNYISTKMLSDYYVILLITPKLLSLILVKVTILKLILKINN